MKSLSLITMIPWKNIFVIMKLHMKLDFQKKKEKKNTPRTIRACLLLHILFWNSLCFQNKQNHFQYSQRTCNISYQWKGNSNIFAPSLIISLYFPSRILLLYMKDEKSPKGEQIVERLAKVNILTSVIEKPLDPKFFSFYFSHLNYKCYIIWFL